MIEKAIKKHSILKIFSIGIAILNRVIYGRRIGINSFTGIIV